MNTVKIFQLSQEEYGLFHGKSASVISIKKDASPELYQLIKSHEGDCEMDYNQEFQDYLDKIPVNNIANAEMTLTPELDTLVLPITAGCNLACPYCFATTNKGDFNFRDYKEEDIDRLLEKLDQKKSETPTTLVFFGGEPLINFKIIKYTIHQVKEKFGHLKINYSITTNGTLLTPAVAKFLKENHVAVLLSLDGYDNEFNYRHFKNGRPSVPRVIKAIELCKRIGLPFEIRATLTSDNPYIFETYMFFEKLQVEYTIAFAYASENKTHENLTEFDELSLKRMRNAFDKLYDYYKDCLRNKKQIYNKLVWGYMSDIQNRVVRDYACTAGRTYHTVMADGTMFSCAHLMNERDCAMGNIDHWPFKHPEKHSFMPVRVNDVDECKKCWALHLCHSGCASQKHSMGRAANQAYVPEKCELDKIQYEFLIKLFYEYAKNKTSN